MTTDRRWPIYARSWFRSIPQTAELRRETENIYDVIARDYYGMITAFNYNNVVLPPGWTVEESATGDITVTHNFGTSDYIVILTAQTGAARWATVNSVNSDTFRILTWNDTGGAARSNVNFHVHLYAQ
jgi:hypothetical protein